jgi:class 3 adenylate cyclase
VVFTDLIGSTELMARMGDAAFDALRGEHFARLREAIAGSLSACSAPTGRGPKSASGSSIFFVFPEPGALSAH